MSRTPNTNTLAKTAGTNGQAPAAIEPAKKGGWTDVLESRKDTFRDLLPKTVDLDRFIRSAAFAIARNPDLARCSQNSLIAAVSTAAELNLDFTPALGLAYMVPYNGVAQFQVGYRGLMTLALREGAARAIEAHCVYANDTFEHEMGTEPRISHRRPKMGDQRGKFVGAYAIVTLANGAKQADVMDLAEIEAVRTRSKSGANGPWRTDYAEMAKKTVVKRLCKYLNLTPAIGRALETDNEDTDLNSNGEHGEGPTKTNRLRAAVGLVEQPSETEPPIDPPHQDDDPPPEDDPQF